ncbi:MAG: class III aminotransferase [Rhodospirillaceae bacterium]|nr:MAG: class III aminotransferase [Rhodospirillaceae bacterium]
MDWQPLLITVAPNGARKNQSDHTALPMTANEMARDAKQCLDAGAAMLHLHVRDENGAHSLDADLYRASIKAVREVVGDNMIIQITTEAVGQYTPDQQIALVQDVLPEAASVAMKELTADGLDKASDFYHWAFESGITLQHILYSPEEVSQLADLVREGIVPGENLNVLYVLGRYGAQLSQPSDLLPFLAAAREQDLQTAMWSVCAFGPGEGAVAVLTISLGGHMRVGFENNFYLNDETLAPNNAALVTQVADGAKLIARSLCQAEQARSLMGSGGKGERKDPLAKTSNGLEDSKNTSTTFTTRETTI